MLWVRVKRFTLSLNSPLNANWFWGFPSGTLYLLNQSTVASRYPGLSRLISLISATNQKTKANSRIQNTLCNWWQVFFFACCRLFIPLKSAASGSSVLITMTFQSVSPSSIKARVPNTFTLIISPREHTWESKAYLKKLQTAELKSVSSKPPVRVVPYFLCHICQ